MKNLFTFLTLILISSLCFAQDAVQFEAKIDNKNGDVLYIKDNNIIVKEIKIDDKGLFYLNTTTHPETALDAHQLSLEVSEQIRNAEQKKAPRQVFVKGDKKVDYGKVVSAMVLLQQAGAINIGLLTESPPPQAV